MPADFNFYLNRQGVRGKKGDKGDKGFSPNITIGDNTQESFTLVVQNEFDSFETPNLKEGLVPEDRNGTYVRLDREAGQQYYGEPDIATESTLGVIKLASQDEVNAGEEETKAVTPSTLASRIAPIETNVADLDTRTSTLETKVTAAESNITALQAQMSTAESDIDTLQSQVATNTNDITSLKGSTSTLESDVTAVESNLSTLESSITEINADITTIEGNISTLETQIPTIATTTKAGTVKPDGTTITITGDGTITAVGGGGGGTGDVTAAGNNVFTGSNTFQQAITLQASSSGQLLNLLDSDSTIIGMITAGNRGGLRFGTLSTTEPFLLSTLSNNQAVYFLNQASVHSGNGITITTTSTTDITIAAEVSQQDIDGLGGELDTLSGKVTSLEGTVSTLETTMPSIATTVKAGTVKPDGTTITITADGTISAVNSGGEVDPNPTFNSITIPTQQVSPNNVVIEGSTNSYGLKVNANYLGVFNISPIGALRVGRSETDCGVIGYGNSGTNIRPRSTSNYLYNFNNDGTITRSGNNETKTVAYVEDLGGGSTGDVTAAGDNTFTGSNMFTEQVAFRSKNWGQLSSRIARLGAKSIGTASDTVLHSVDDIFVGTINNDPSGVNQRAGSIYLASEGISSVKIKPFNRNTLDIQPNDGIQSRLRVTTDGVGFVNRSGTYQQFATSADLTNLGAFKYVVITAEDYTSLSPKDPDTLYRVTTDGATTAVYLGEIKLSA